jgi:phospholipid transport system substrate-binding protein
MYAWNRPLIVGLLLGSLLLAGTAPESEAGEPLEKIRRTVNDVLAILSNDTLAAQERRDHIRQTVLQRFGFEEMAQRALGRHWRDRTAQQRQEFVELFTDLLERSYVARIETASGEQYKVQYLEEEIEDGYATVHTEIVRARDLNTRVDYRLLYEGGDWKVYDVVIAGVSLVNNYRMQFNKFILEDSYADLVKRMRVKLQQEQTAGRDG